MNASEQPDWRPDPQLLGAYFDGELEARDESAELRRRIEAWIAQHPDGRGQWAAHQALRRAWLETTPTDPNPAKWDAMYARLAAERRRPALQASERRSWAARFAVAASIAILIGSVAAVARLTFLPAPTGDPVAAIAPNRVAHDDEVFVVAMADEVIVSYIEGADAHALTVGRLPVQEPLELAEIGDVRVVAVRSDAEPHLRPQVDEDGPRRPMIWIPLEPEED